MKADCLPEHVFVTERPKPEHVHVVRQRRPASEEDARKDGDDQKEAAAPPRRIRPRPVNGFGHCVTPFLLAFYCQSSRRPQKQDHSKLELSNDIANPTPHLNSRSAPRSAWM